MDHSLAKMREYPVCSIRTYEYTVGGRIYQGTPLSAYVEKNRPSKHLYGKKSEGYLHPYYYCSPASPFEVHEYVKGFFPELLCYQSRYDDTTHRRLAICYLSDQAMWEDAVSLFIQSNVAVQAGVYDYLFKRAVQAEREGDARAISLAFLGNVENAKGDVDQAQADIARFYLSCLGQGQ